MTERANALVESWESRWLPLRDARAQALDQLARTGSEQAMRTLATCLTALDRLHAEAHWMDAVFDSLLEPQDDPALEARLLRLLKEVSACQGGLSALERQRELEAECLRLNWSWRCPDTGSSLPELERALLATRDPEPREALWRKARAAGRELAVLRVTLEQVRRQRAIELGYGDARAMRLGLGGIDPETLDAQCQFLERLSRSAWEQARTDLAGQLGFSDPACWDFGDTLDANWLVSELTPLPGEVTARACLEFGRDLLDSLGLPMELVARVRCMAESTHTSPRDLCLLPGLGEPVIHHPGGDGLRLPRFLKGLGGGLGLFLADPEHSPCLRDTESILVESLALMLARLADRGQLLAPWLPAGITIPANPALRSLRLYRLRRMLRDQRFEAVFCADPDQDPDALFHSLDQELLWGPHARSGPAGAWAAGHWPTGGALPPAEQVIAELASWQMDAAMSRDLECEDSAIGWLQAGPAAGGWLADRLIVTLGETAFEDQLEDLCGQPLNSRPFCLALNLLPQAGEAEADEDPDLPA
ncbi:MAG: hypothetical protein KDC10_11425 [Calditrichaeota bacterium]|nr:hypothetical protein [Calditrichota bacterium]